MNINELEFKSKKAKKRAGRGISAGRGKTAGRGTKGQNSRSGGQRNPGFEGGQNPLFQRIPKKKGFNSPRVKPATITTSELNALKTTTVTNEKLYEAGIVESGRDVKLLFDEKPKKAYKVHLQSASESARRALEDASGEFKSVDRIEASKTTAKANKKTARNKK